MVPSHLGHRKKKRRGLTYVPLEGKESEWNVTIPATPGEEPPDFTQAFITWQWLPLGCWTTSTTPPCASPAASLGIFPFFPLPCSLPPFLFFKASTGIRTNLRHKNTFWDTWVTNSYYLSNHAFTRSSLCKRESGPSLQVRADFGDGGEPQQPSLSANFSPELTVLSHPTKPPRVRPEKQGDMQAVLHQEAENSWNCSRDRLLEKCNQINEAVGGLWVYQ